MIRGLKADSELSRTLNGGELPWTNNDHRVADLWSLWAKQEHPVRAEMEAKARHAKKVARMSKKQADFEKRKRAYGLGGDVI